MKVLFATDTIFDIWANTDSLFDSYSALDTALSRKFEISISPGSLIDLAGMLSTEELESEVSQSCALENTLEVFSVLDIHEQDCIRASGNDASRFREALIAYSAERNEIDLIVSHDKKAYAVSLVPVVTPCEFVGIYRLENVSYDLVELPIEEVRRIVEPIADKYGAKRVSLFGSRARGDAVAGSDFDILLDKGRIRGMRVLDFQEELSKALRCKVDVATTQGVSARFLEKIQQYEVVLFEAQ